MLNKEYVYASEMLWQCRDRRDKQMPLAHEWSQSERTLCGPPQGRKGVNTELVLRYSTTRRIGAMGRITRPTGRHCPGSLLKSPHLQRGSGDLNMT